MHRLEAVVTTRMPPSNPISAHLPPFPHSDLGQLQCSVPVLHYSGCPTVPWFWQLPYPATHPLPKSSLPPKPAALPTALLIQSQQGPSNVQMGPAWRGATQSPEHGQSCNLRQMVLMWPHSSARLPPGGQPLEMNVGLG